MRFVDVTGVGIWTAGFPEVESWRSGIADPAAVAPPADRLPPALRRRATSITRMAAEAGAQAASQAGGSLSETPLVLGSAYGEIETAVAMIRSFHEGEGMPSPTRFHNSVHNTAVGYLSIATGNTGFVTALAAGDDTAAMALLEARALIASRGGDGLVILADEPVPAPLGDPARAPAAAVAFFLSAGSDVAALARLGPIERRSMGAAPDPLCGRSLARHPCAGGFALLDAILERRSGWVALGRGEARWSVEVEGRLT